MRPARLSPGRKTRALALLSLTELLGMSVWFSASAVVPALTAAWGLAASGQAWLTMSVQIGFVAGALGSAVLNLADRLPGAMAVRGLIHFCGNGDPPHPVRRRPARGPRLAFPDGHPPGRSLPGRHEDRWPRGRGKTADSGSGFSSGP